MSDVNPIKRGPGRPPLRQEAVREASEVKEPVREKKVRTRKRSGSTDQLYIPPELIPEGMDFQWVADSVLGQPVVNHRISFEANGWEPVPATRFPGMFMPKGYQGEINVGGLVLMERPLELTLEAREEDRQAAVLPKQTADRQINRGQVEGVTLDTQHPSAQRSSFVRREIVQPGTIPVPE